jgi:hypothetical protein
VNLKISRVLHAGYLFEYEGTTIAFDPIFENPFSKNCYAFPEIEFDLNAVRSLKLDAIFISHYHDDHFSLESLNLLDKSTPIYIFSVFEELNSLLHELGFKNVHSIELRKQITIGAFEILPLEALDADIDSIYHIKAGGKNILNVVDSWLAPSTMDKLLRTKWDLILWPFQTLREIEVISPSTSSNPPELPHEWLEQLQMLKPKAVIGSSCQFRFETWSWYNQAFFPISYARFAQEISKILPETNVHKLNPGECLDLGFKKNGRLSWIKPVGDQNVDYEFDPKAKPQPISEIAQKFPALSASQKKFVETYCQETLLERLLRLNFSFPFVWCLAVYDHEGTARNYHYQIGDQPMETLNWKTEIAEAKLFGALAEGESLTSIYIRVTPLPDTDPLTDPLIRCLYEGIVGGYQQAQLLRISELKN